jgi:hypothetical protein
MNLSKRYGMLILMIACFQALFFVPLLTAPEVLVLGGNNNFSEILLGASPFLLHYQSLGLFPIVLAGLSVTILPLIDKGIDRRMIAKYKVHLTYLFGGVIGFGVVARSSLSWNELQSYTVFIELMMSLQIIIMIIKVVETLKIASSAVLIFFAWNVLTVTIRDMYLQITIAENEQWLLVVFSLLLMLVSIYIAQYFLKSKRDLVIAYISPIRGYQVVDKIKLKAVQVSILPVVVVSMSLGTVSTYFITPVPGVMLLSNWIYCLLFGIVLLCMTRVFTKDKAKKPVWLSHIESMGGKVIDGNNKVLMNTSDAIDRWVDRRMWEQWFVLMCLLVAADLVNLWFIAANLSPVSYVAGLGIWLLTNAALDMHKQYDKLVYIYM